ncbi:MAG: glycoside hydrolase family 9 protein [Bacteroidales bacterium]|nr:glycoside hydrolase family 9 protein [Bacteroidales bacterium]
MNRKTTLSVALAMMLFSMSANAEIKLQEIRTSSSNVIQMWFRSDKLDVNEVSVSNPQDWKVNGKPAIKLSRSAAPFEKECDHYVYLTVPTLKDGKTYKISTPYGNYNFKFDDDKVLCESIKTNQAAYSALSTKRFANFAIYLGDAGSQKIEGKLPTYKVVRTADGKQITSGSLTEIGEDKSSGDFVYRMDLSAVPEGGPYKVVVAGYGTSYPFAVGGEFSQRLSYLSFRALLNQRCGIQLEEPYVEHSYRHDKCHETIYQTYYRINEASLPVKGDEPTIKAWGGYHDAGDADRRTYHMIVPSTLLTTYEAFSELFTDDQFNIPDIFDEEFNILGKGNKIPDILDEAEWGTMFWKYFQEEDGQIPWGTETMGYSPFTTYDKEDHLFGSEVLDSRTSAWASGLFYHFARLIQPYNKAKADEYQSRAELAWNASNKAYAEAGREMAKTFKMYYNVEKYLMTGDQACHQYIKEHASDANAIAETYNVGTEAFANQAWLVSYFFSYVLAPSSKTDAATVAIFKEALKKAADKQVDLLNVNAYPTGAPANVNWWGSNVAQGQYSYPMLMMWKLTGEQKYIDTVSQMMDYALGLNPLGKCFMTQIGFNRAEYPHDRESAYTLEMGWGSRPGILIFGPGNYAPNYPSYPAIKRGQTPRERAYIEIVDNYQNNEFTIYQSLCFPAAVYPILSNGVNKNDHTKDPYGYKTY